MNSSSVRSTTASFFAGFASVFLVAAQSTDAPPMDPAAPQTQPASAPAPVPPTALHDEPVDAVELLLKQVELMREELVAGRVVMAQMQLELSEAQRQRDELQQFVNDHQVFGDDFQKYQAVRRTAEADARRRAVEEARHQRELERAQREERQRAARAQRMERDALAARVQRYRNAGFGPIGLDVFTSRMAFFYPSRDVAGTQWQWNIDIGNFLSPLPPMTEIDYSTMTISGSVINAADEVRDIGVAITFFDDNGNQVGHETVQIKNARPDVPYPFTSKIDMALNRPFSSQSTYVLYADPSQSQ